MTKEITNKIQKIWEELEYQYATKYEQPLHEKQTWSKETIWLYKGKLEACLELLNSNYNAFAICHCLEVQHAGISEVDNEYLQKFCNEFGLYQHYTPKVILEV